MEELVIRSEDPIRHQWRLLARFAYPGNIDSYVRQRTGSDPEPILRDYIASCIRQGEAYFAASSSAAFDIAPVLVYYGAANLLLGAVALLEGSVPDVGSHGMRVASDAAPGTPIGETVLRLSDPQRGALHRILASIPVRPPGLPSGSEWTLKELLGSVPDLRDEYLMCYPNDVAHTIPLERASRSGTEFDRILPSDVARHGNPMDAFSKVLGFKAAYITPQLGGQLKYIILHRKVGADDIGDYSVFGGKYLLMAHEKNGRLFTPGQLAGIYMSLFAIAFVSRYRPSLWNPFVRADESGERLLIERLLDVAHRHLPNLVLNRIEDRLVRFSNQPAEVVEIAREQR